MSYKVILTQAEAGDRADARLACAADLADRFGATLRGIGANFVKPSGITAPYNAFEAAWIVTVRDELETDLRLAEESFRRIAGSRRCTWETRRVEPAVAVAEASRAADLIVMGGSKEADAGTCYSAEVAKVILTSGRPVLVAPPEGAYCAARRILIAWKDTREARRAIVDALPLLERAEDVVVLELSETDDMEGIEQRTLDVAEFLKRHGVPARPEAALAGRSEAVEKVEERAADLGADLIVAGGYGHSRLGEWVFGGVTRGLLKQTERHVLFSH